SGEDRLLLRVRLQGEVDAARLDHGTVITAAQTHHVTGDVVERKRGLYSRVLTRHRTPPPVRTPSLARSGRPLGVPGRVGRARVVATRRREARSSTAATQTSIPLRDGHPVATAQGWRPR